jgi:hypothetical protein
MIMRAGCAAARGDFRVIKIFKPFSNSCGKHHLGNPFVKKDYQIQHLNKAR